MRALLRVAALAIAVYLGAGPAAAQRATVTWITHPVLFDVTGKGDLLKRFEAETGIHVEVTSFPSDALAARIQTELVGGSPAFDVMSMASFWTESLARFVEPIEPLNDKSPIAGGLGAFFPAMLQQFRIPQTPEGRLYGIPQRIAADILFYRKDLLDQAGLGVPKTLDEYYAAAKALTKPAEGDRPAIYGAVFQGVQSSFGVLDYYDWASPLGVDLLAPPDWRRAAFNTPAGVRALDMRRRFLAEGLASPGVLSYSFDDAINAVAQGRAAMSIMTDAYWAPLQDAARSSVVGRIGYAPAPRDPAVERPYFARGWALFLNRRSRNKDAAWEFIKWITAPEQQLWMAVNHGNPISRIALAEHPDYRARVPVAAASSATHSAAKVIPNSPQFNRVQDILARHLNAAIAGRTAAADALQSAEREVNEVLRP